MVGKEKRGMLSLMVRCHHSLIKRRGRCVGNLRAEPDAGEKKGGGGKGVQKEKSHERSRQRGENRSCQIVKKEGKQ